MVDRSDKHLKGWWKINETSGTSLRDEQGTSHVGTIVGGVTFVAGGSKLSGKSAILGDGINGYVSISNSPIVSQGSSCSIAAWVKATTTSQGADQRIIAKAYGSVQGNRAGSLAWENTGGYFAFYYPTGQTTTGQLTADSNPVTAGVWYHVACVYDNFRGEALIYINGKLVKKTTGLSTVTNYGGTSNAYFFTEQNTGTPTYFSGAIEDVRIYDKALSGQEVLNIMHGFGYAK